MEDEEEHEEVDYSLDEETERQEDTDQAETADDIYADLYDAQGEQGTLLKSKYAALQEQCQGQEATIQKLRHKIEELISEKSDLTEERRILIRNISCLYRTAREELYRRDDELKQRANIIEELKAQERQRRPYSSGQAAPYCNTPAALPQLALPPFSAGGTQPTPPSDVPPPPPPMLF